MEAEEREIAARVHVKYVDWCEVYGKELDEARFRTFLSNFLAMEAHADETGQTMLLNQWYDCTREEHMLAVEAEEQEKADHEARIAAHAVEMAKAEEEKKLALKAQRKIAEKAMKHKKKAVDLARIAQEHWKKAEKEAKLAAETEAKVRNEDKYILAAGNNVLARSSDEVALVQTTEARLRQEAGKFRLNILRRYYLGKQTFSIFSSSFSKLQWSKGLSWHQDIKCKQQKQREWVAFTQFTLNGATYTGNEELSLSSSTLHRTLW